MFHWLKPAVAFCRRHHKELAARPVWMFSSGPLGTDLVDKDGKNVLETTRPKEFDELAKLLHPRGEQVFFGAYDPDAPPVGVGERFVQHMPAARAALPGGDFRDWPAIDAWATQIAAELAAAKPRGSDVTPFGDAAVATGGGRGNGGSICHYPARHGATVVSSAATSPAQKTEEQLRLAGAVT